MAALQFGLHKVPEGTIGVYYRGGAILPQTSEPGYHFHTPFVTRVEPVQINIQTDLVRNIPCGTQGGTVIHFEKIEVVNRLRRENVLQTVKDYGVNYVRPPQPCAPRVLSATVTPGQDLDLRQDPPRNQPVLFVAPPHRGVHYRVRYG